MHVRYIIFLFFSTSFRREYLNAYENNDDDDVLLCETTKTRIDIKIDMKIELLKRKSFADWLKREENRFATILKSIFATLLNHDWLTAKIEMSNWVN